MAMKVLGERSSGDEEERKKAKIGSSYPFGLREKQRAEKTLGQSNSQISPAQKSMLILIVFLLPRICQIVKLVVEKSIGALFVISRSLSLALDRCITRRSVSEDQGEKVIRISLYRIEVVYSMFEP